MFKPLLRACTVSTLVLLAAAPAHAQFGRPMTDSVKAQRWAVENELQSLAVVDRKVMITMRDGIRIPADIYRPKDKTKQPTYLR